MIYVSETIVGDPGRCLYEGDIANYITLMAGNGEPGVLTISGGTANNIIIQYNGFLFLHQGIAENSIIYSGGALNVESGGTAEGSLIYGGTLNVSGGTAENTTVICGGHLFVYSSGTVDNTTVNSGGQLYVLNGGTAENTTVNSGGQLYVSSGGTAENTTVNSGGNLYVSNGGSAENTTVSYGGDLYVSSGGTAENTTVSSGGRLNVYSGGTADNIAVSLGGFLYVSSGGTAFSIKENGGYIVTASDAQVTFEENYFSDITLQGQSATIHSGTTANKICISRGQLYLLSGGIANNTMAIADGGIFVFNGGTANSTILASSSFIVVRGGIANNTTVNSKGGLSVYSGGIANNAIVNSSGNIFVRSSGTVENVNVNCDGTLYISSNGTADNIIVNSGGIVHVSSGGTANSMIENGGCVYIEDGATVSFVSNIISELTLKGTEATIHSGTTANNVYVGADDHYDHEGCLKIYNGGIAYDTTIDAMGECIVFSGGTACNVIQLAGGVSICSGGVLTGKYIGHPGNANVHLEQGAIVNFNVYECAASSEPMIGNLDSFGNHKLAVYTITVAENQAKGKYFLVGNASSFDNSVTIQNTQGFVFGSTTVGGENVYVNDDYDFSLTIEDDNLCLTVSEKDKIPPVITLYADTAISLQHSTITAVTEDGVDIYYSTDNDIWEKYIDRLDVTTNGIWYFKATDAAGNVGTASIEFTNIDTIAPIIELTGDTTTPLQKSSVTATTEAGLDIFYSLDNTNWQKYTGKLDVTANGTWYFKATDAAGNVGTASIEFTNIDTVAPVIELTGDNTTPLQKSSVTATTESGVDIYYSQNNENWNKYTGVLDVTVNGTWYFKAMDAAGNIGTAEITYNNIDTTAPEIILTGDTLTPLQKSTLIASTEPALIIYYSPDNKFWAEYTDEIEISSNGAWYFKATDAAGNVGTAFIEFTNIDTVAPVIELTGDTTTPLQKSSVTASTEAGLDIYYSQDNTNWEKYSGKLDVTTNGTWYFKATDAAGNIGTNSIEFANIDTVAPVIELTGDTTTSLQKSSLTATTEAGLDIYYSQDNTNWKKYIGKLDVTANGTWYFKATDAAGNIGTISIEFANIDTVVPVIELTGDTTTPLQKSSVTATTEAGLDIYYSQDNTNWKKYIGKLDVTANGTWYFKATDAAGNIGTNSIEFTNIDTVAPVIELTGDTMTSLQKSSLTATTEAGLDIFYSQDNTNWKKYTGKLDVTANGTWYFKATDAAGNIGINSIEFTNIDTVAPVIELTGDTTTPLQKSSVTATTEAGLDIYYSQDNEAWTKYSGKLDVITNGSWYFKATDVAGNVGMNSIEFTNIDTVAPVIELTGDTTTPLQKSSVTATTEVGLDIYYSLDNTNWKKYIGKLDVTANGTWYFKATDAAGNIGTNSIEFANIDTVAPVIELTGDTITPLQKSSVTATTEAGLDIYYSQDNTNWKKYTGKLDVTANGTWYFKTTDAAGNIGTNSIEFANIDTVAPVIELTGDTTTSLQKSSLTATTEAGLDIYYSQDNTNWKKYTGKLDVTTNGTWYFKTTDAAGNIGTNFIEFTNIDTVAPVIELSGDTTTPLQKSSVTATTEAGLDIYYSQDNTNWKKYIGKLDVTTNGTWYFKATDVAGNIGTNSIDFANIDTVAPVIELTGDTTAPLQKSSVAATTEAGLDIYYSQDNEAWTKYSGKLDVITNGSWYFKATDAAGNVGTNSIEFTNIDAVVPVIELTGDTTTPLQKSSVTATTEAGLYIFYSQDNTNWKKYTGKLDVTVNGTWYFKATDAAGNVGTASIEFTNIDTVAPVIELTGDTTTSLQKSSVTATTEAGVDIYYSQDNTNWKKYSGKLDVTANGTWYFKATDAAGNIGTASIEFKNIDIIAPIIELTGDTTTSLQKSSVTATTEAGLDIYYSQDNTNWKKYLGKLDVTSNGTWYFKATDAAGNIGTASIEFTNIDTVAPVIELTGDTTTLLQKSSVTASTEAGLDIYYSQDNTNWKKYTGRLEVTTNGTWYFKATDAAGNIGTNSINFTNIDTVAPVIKLTGDTKTVRQQSSVMATTEVGLDIYYSTDNKSWQKYNMAISISDNGTWYFKATDKAGNVGTNSITFKNIDNTAPEIQVSEKAQDSQVLVTAVFSDNVQVATKQYRIGSGSWQDYTAPVVMEDNGVVEFKAIDAAGNEAQRKYEVDFFADGPKFNIPTVKKYDVSLSWSKITAAKGVKVTYQVQIGADKIITVSTNTYTLKNAAVGTETYQVRAVFSNGEKTAWSNEVTATVKDITAPKTGNITAITQTGENAVLVKWKAATDNDAIKEYRVTCGGKSATVEADVLEYAFTGLSGKITATVQAVDQAGNVGSIMKSTYTMHEMTPPTAPMNLTGKVDNKNGGTLSWDKSTDNVGVVKYEVRLGDKTYTTSSPSLKVAKMAVGEYKFTVSAIDKSGNRSTTAEGKFTCTDAVAPVTGKIISIKQTGADSMAVNWATATDDVGIGKYIVTCGKKSVEIEGDKTSCVLTGVAGNVTVSVQAIDQSGNKGNIVTKSYSMMDVTPPTTPTNLTGNVNNKNGGTLSWDKSTDSVGVVKYEVKIGSKTYTTSTNFLKVAKMSTGDYDFTVTAIDKAGNRSNAAKGNFTSTDAVAPVTGKITSIEQRSEDSIIVNWAAATDDGGIGKYIVICGKQSLEVEGDKTSCILTGVAGKVTVSVQAIDKSKNAGNIVKSTYTMHEMTPPTTPTNLTGKVDNKNGGTLSWDKSTDSVGVVKYEVKIGSKTYTTKTNSLKVAKMSAGEYGFTVTAIDKAGNRSESTSGTFTCEDTVDPVIKKFTAKLVASADDPYLQLNWLATDETELGDFEFKLDGQACSTLEDNTQRIDLDGFDLAVGSHKLQLTVWDAAGNDTDKLLTFKVSAKDHTLLASK